jgi:hypothetical protein
LCGDCGTQVIADTFCATPGSESQKIYTLYDFFISSAYSLLSAGFSRSRLDLIDAIDPAHWILIDSWATDTASHALTLRGVFTLYPKHGFLIDSNRQAASQPKLASRAESKHEADRDSRPAENFHW